jgi:lon-related putative ATP-dependent protease
MTANARELSADEVSFTCDPSRFDFETTAELPDLVTIIGQDRAVRAIDFGVSIPSYGFNVYVMGPSGTGKSTTVQKFLYDLASEEPRPDDICFVNNFEDSRRPKVILLPAGVGSQFRQDISELIRNLRLTIPTAFDSDDFAHRSAKVEQEVDQARTHILQKLDAKAGEHDFGLVQTASGFGLVPLLDGEALTPEQFHALPQDEKNKYESQLGELQEDLNRSLRDVRELEKSGQEKMRTMTRELADALVTQQLSDLNQEYATYPNVIAHLLALRADIVDNIGDFLPTSVGDSAEDAPPDMDVPRILLEDPLRRYHVNLIVDHSASTGAPVVYETNPSYLNLVGRIEQEVRYGMMTTDFTHIRSGSLHRANGGYLVINSRDLLEQPLAWEALERTIKNQEIRTEMISETLTLAAPTKTLEPEPVPFNAKIILIGDWSTYAILYDMDEDFRKFFKVRADFSSHMERSPESVQQYAQFVASRIRADGLLPFDRGAVARIVEEGVRLVQDQNRLSTRFASIVEIIQEASFWAKRSERSLVTAEDVDRTMEEKRYRASRFQEEMRRQILEGTIKIHTEGSAVGQVNGLSVLEVADYEFGMPARISAKTFLGKGNVVGIDRESNLTGNIHNKGLLILQGYLGAKFAQKRQISLSASLTFEQNYDRIEGDSASTAELYALLSSLSNLPIRQDLAVTGSVDQEGRVQAIGAPSAKIEGFFEICRERGLTGTQGVLIPAANVPHLVLQRDVVDAVRNGDFHIYAVETIDQGIQLLTGVPAGEPDAEGDYAPHTVNRLVDDRLREMLEGKEEKSEPEKEQGAHDDALLSSQKSEGTPAEDDEQ